MMKCKMEILAALVFLAVSRPDALPRGEANESKKDHSAKGDEKKNDTTATVKITISAEGHSSLPTDSHIEWAPVTDGGCRGEDNKGEKRLVSDGATSVSLPVCKLHLEVFITGFETKAVMVDLAVDKDRYSVPITIRVKHQGPAELDWPEHG